MVNRTGIFVRDIVILKWHKLCITFNLYTIHIQRIKMNFHQPESDFLYPEPLTTKRNLLVTINKTDYCNIIW